MLLRIRFKWVIVLICLLSSFSLAQEIVQESSSQDVEPTYSEYDRWQGSSLGIRVETKDGKFTVSKVLPHLEDSVLEVGDQLVLVGDVDLTKEPLSKIGDMLKGVKPATEIPVKIVRDEEEMSLQVSTYRLEFVDIASIVERIQKNRIIQDHLEELDRAAEMETITDRMVSAVRGSDSPREAHEGINQVIDEIGISHTAIVPKATYQQLVTSSGCELGLVLRRFKIDDRNGYYVVDIKPGSTAFNGEIQLGDEITFLNGVKIDESRRLVLAGEEQRYQVFSLSANVGETIRIEHRSHPGEAMQTTSLTTEKTVSLQDSVSASVRVIESGDRSVGYIRFWNLMSISANKELQSRMETTFKDCDALVLDLRGRGGVVPAVLAVDRTVGKLEIPVIAITDELTRSAKELLSFRIKLHEHVTVIGERTSGAVTAATFATLPSGNVLMYPVMSSDALKRYTDGTILEGNGVEPDEPINFYEPYCAGIDRLLTEAIDRAAKAAKFD